MPPFELLIVTGDWALPLMGNKGPRETISASERRPFVVRAFPAIADSVVQRKVIRPFETHVKSRKQPRDASAEFIASIEASSGYSHA